MNYKGLLQKYCQKNKFKFCLPVYFGKPTICLFIDIENKPKIIDEIIEKIDLKYKNFNELIKFYVCRSSDYNFNERKYIGLEKVIEQEYTYGAEHKYASKMNMIFTCGKVSHMYNHIGIIADDHFGNSLVEIINEHNMENTSKLLRNIDDVIDFLQSISF